MDLLLQITLVSRRRSSPPLAGNSDANFGDKRDTRIIGLLVWLCFGSSFRSKPRVARNFRNATLGRTEVEQRPATPFAWPWPMLVAMAILLIDASTAAMPAHAEPAACPAALATASQLLLVSATSLNAQSARLRLFERASSDAEWLARGRPSNAVIGRNGLAWARSESDRPDGRARVKVEGDGKTPAGVFRLGAAFGFAASDVEGYVRLVPGRHLCVDDPASPSYNTVVSETPRPAGLKGEEMGKIGLYRRGFFVDYPTNAAQRAGSCIFVHVWRSPTSGTSGCVALPLPTVEELHRWVRPKQALIAILPGPEAEELVRCLAMTN